MEESDSRTNPMEPSRVGWHRRLARWMRGSTSKIPTESSNICSFQTQIPNWDELIRPAREELIVGEFQEAITGVNPEAKEETEMEELSMSNGQAEAPAKRHLDSLSTTDVLERYKYVESAIAAIDGKHQELVREMDALEKNRNEADAERRELGKLIIKRFNLGEALPTVNRRPLSDPTQPRKRRKQKWTIRGNNAALLDYLHKNGGSATFDEIATKCFPAKTRVAASVAMAKAQKDGLIKHGAQRGHWMLAR